MSQTTSNRVYVWFKETFLLEFCSKASCTIPKNYSSSKSFGVSQQSLKTTLDGCFGNLAIPLSYTFSKSILGPKNPLLRLQNALGRASQEFVALCCAIGLWRNEITSTDISPKITESVSFSTCFSVIWTCRWFTLGGLTPRWYEINC